MTDWKSFLDTIDAEETDAAVLAATEKYFRDIGMASPAAAAGITNAKLGARTDFPDNPVVQAFISRTVDTLTPVAAARRTALETAGATSSAPNLGSAMGLATALAPPKRVNTVAELEKACVKDMPFALMLDQSLVERMSAETDAARAASRPAFLYVELASKEVLPLWIAPESVGGRPDEDEVRIEDEHVGSLAKLGQAIKEATEAKRYFTSVAQWSAAYWKWAPFTAAFGHFTWSQALLHFNSVMRLVEEEKIEGRGPSLAFLFDDMLRRQIEKRAEKADPTLRLDSLLAEADRSTVAAARQRLNGLLKPTPLGSGSSGSQDLARASATSMKEDAKRAARALNAQQDERAAATGAFQGKGGGKRSLPWESQPKQLSGNKLKKHQWQRISFP